MARKHYIHSDETFKAVVDHEADIAKEHECDASYIYGIKNRKHPDPFPPFRQLYRATARGGGDTRHWRLALDEIDESVKPAGRETGFSDLLIRKVSGENASTEEFLRGIADGQLDEDETLRLITLMEQVKSNALMAIGVLVRHRARLRGELGPLRAA